MYLKKSAFILLVTLSFLLSASVHLDYAQADRSEQTQVAKMEKEDSNSDTYILTLFFLFPDAKKVALAGSFNDWDASRNLMMTKGDGQWEITLKLPLGSYEYQFVIDDLKWVYDPRAIKTVKNPEGKQVSVLYVPKYPLPVQGVQKASPPPVVRRKKPPPISTVNLNTFSPFFTMGFTGGLTSGRLSPEVVPLGEAIGIRAAENGFMAGIVAEYHFNQFISVFGDFNFHYNRKLIANAGGLATSLMTGRIGPFPQNTYFHMQNFGFRGGAKVGYHVGNIRPWVGVGGGVYSWYANYANANQSLTYGSATGVVPGVTVLGGVDLSIPFTQRNRIVLTVFGESGSPVATPVINDLFGIGLNSSRENHIMGPTRIGTTLSFGF